MSRNLLRIILGVCLVAFAASEAHSHPRRRAVRHYGPHTHVYVQHEHYGSSLRGFPRTPYVQNYSLGAIPPLWYGWGPSWGFASGAWINAYPWWGWSGGYYGVPYYYPNYYGASLTTGNVVPYLADNGGGNSDPIVADENGLPLTTIVDAGNRRGAVKPEVREWLPLVKPDENAPPADAADTLRSLRYQTEGDIQFRKGDYANAYLMYSKSAVMDERRAEPKLRMALTSMANRHWDRALRELRLALELNPELAVNSETLESVFGENNEAAKSEFIDAARRWAEQNIQDPDRLFVLGAILQFNDQMQNAAPLFQQVARIDDSDPHVGLFLSREIDNGGLRIIGSRKDKNDVPPPPPPGEGLPVVVPATETPSPPQRSRVRGRSIERFGKSQRKEVPKPPLPLDALPTEPEDAPVEAKRPTIDDGPQFPVSE